jgi:hypothetical protein
VFKLLRFRILFAVAAILMAMMWAHRAMHTTEGIVGGVNEPALASTEFRVPIAKLEARLFAASPLSMEERVVLAREFDGVGKALEARGTHMARYSAREVHTLAAMSRGLGELGGSDLERVRANWMRVRANTFDDAAWFRFSEKDPAATPEEKKVPMSAADRATVEALRPALDKLEYAIERGERDCDRLGEPEPSGSTDEHIKSSWRDWSASWRDELERIRSWLPAEPEVTAALGVRFAKNRVDEALKELAAVPGSVTSGGRAPYRVEWTRRFQNARRNVKSARDIIAEVERGGPGSAPNPHYSP